MKNLFHLVSSIIIVLSAFMLPACKRENLLAERPQAKVKEVAKNPGQVVSAGTNTDCLQPVCCGNDREHFVPKKKTSFHCFYLTEPDNFVDRCITCASEVPDLRMIVKPDPWDYNFFAINEKVLCVQYYNFTQNRDASYFILRENATLSRELAEELGVTRRIVPAGRHIATYDAARELYVTYIMLQ